VAPIYSTKLINASYTTGPFTITLYAVPVGATVVVTDIDVYLGETAAGQVSFVGIGALLMLVRHSTGAGDVNERWGGKQVLYGGDTIKFHVDCANAGIAITGYLLN
jgi:hypothetical protein